MAWEAKCPVCGGKNLGRQGSESDEWMGPSEKPNTIRCCNDCRFQWSTELTPELLGKMAMTHNNQRHANTRPNRHTEEGGY